MNLDLHEKAIVIATIAVAIIGVFKTFTGVLCH
jgi:hypothetical protein